jgi:hypothetical protein
MTKLTEAEARYLLCLLLERVALADEPATEWVEHGDVFDQVAARYADVAGDGPQPGI